MCINIVTPPVNKACAEEAVLKNIIREQLIK